MSVATLLLTRKEVTHIIPLAGRLGVQATSLGGFHHECEGRE